MTVARTHPTSFDPNETDVYDRIDRMGNADDLRPARGTRALIADRRQTVKFPRTLRPHRTLWNPANHQVHAEVLRRSG